MNTRTKTIAAVGLGAVGIGGIWYASQDRFNTSDGYPLEDGALMWTPRFEEESEPGQIRDINGSDHPIGSYGAVNASYEMAAHYSLLLTRMTQIAEASLADDQRRELYQGFLATGVYPVAAVCDDGQAIMIANMVQAAVNFGVALRMMAYIFDAAGVTPSYRPSVWVRRHVDMRNIRFAGMLNPMAIHGGQGWSDRWATAQARTSEWNAIGIQTELRWLQAYLPALEAVPGMQDWLAEVQGDLNEIEGTMGVIPAAVAIAAAKAIGIIIIAAAGAYCVITAMHAVFAYLGLNYQYLDTMAEQYEAALECARDPNRTPEERAICAEQARELADRQENYTPGWSRIVQVGAMGAVVLGVIYGVKRIRSKSE